MPNGAHRRISLNHIPVCNPSGAAREAEEEPSEAHVRLLIGLDYPILVLQIYEASSPLLLSYGSSSPCPSIWKVSARRTRLLLIRGQVPSGAHGYFLTITYTKGKSIPQQA